jgi:hypothetical protein
MKSKMCIFSLRFIKIQFKFFVKKAIIFLLIYIFFQTIFFLLACTVLAVQLHICVNLRKMLLKFKQSLF